MTSASAADVLSDFRRAAESAGLVFRRPVVADGKLHRCDFPMGRKKGIGNGWYVLHAEPRPAAGAFGSWSTGQQDTWCETLPARMTPRERKESETKFRAMREAREAALAEAQEATAAAAAAIWAAATPADPSHPYLVRKGVRPFNLRLAPKTIKYVIIDEEKPNRLIPAGSLLVPLYGPDKKLWSLQTISSDGKKLFLKNTRKAGHYTSIGKLTDILVIAEGWATAASIHIATGFCVVVAFDSGNLRPVAEAIRLKYPDHRIIIAADDDHATTEPPNPGLHSAVTAAEAVDGTVAFPTGLRAVSAERGQTVTDFNDLHLAHGTEAVATAFASPLSLEAAREILDPTAGPPDNVISLDEVRAARAGDEPPPHDAIPEGADDEPDRPAEVVPIRRRQEPRAAMPGEGGPIPLGFSKTGGGQVYHYMAAGTKIINDLAPSAHSEANLCALAPLSYWETEFASKKGVLWGEARQAMFHACEAAGYFDPSRVVGRGVMLDTPTGADETDARIVVHLGDKLIVDGRANPDGLVLQGSEWIYESARPLKLRPCKPLDAAGGRVMLAAFEMFPWVSDDLAPLFVGWLFTAPICGALRWRPHAWIIGPRGSGKSTLMRFARAILGSTALKVEGKTTEAAIRQELNGDALPVVFDEAESQNERSREVLQAIIDLARQSSAEEGASIIKGGQGGKAIRYLIRSMFLFGSINKGATQAADESRIIEFGLSPTDPDGDDEARVRAEAHYQELKAAFAKLLTPDFSSRLFARALLNVRRIRDAADVFRTAIAERSGDARVADTCSVPFAGWWCLTRDGEVDINQARSILTENRWMTSAAERQATAADHDQALAFLLDQRIKVTPAREDTVAALILAASRKNMALSGDVPQDTEAADALLKVGIKVVPFHDDPGYGAVYIGSSHDAITRMYWRTPWAEGKWAAILKAHPRAFKVPGLMSLRGAKKRVFGFRIEDIVTVG